MLSNPIPQEQALYNATLAESLGSLTGVPLASIQAGKAVGDPPAADILALRGKRRLEHPGALRAGDRPGAVAPDPPEYTFAWGRTGPGHTIRDQQHPLVPAAAAPRAE